MEVDNAEETDAESQCSNVAIVTAEIDDASQRDHHARQNGSCVVDDDGCVFFRFHFENTHFQLNVVSQNPVNWLIENG